MLVFATKTVASILNAKLIIKNLLYFKKYNSLKSFLRVKNIKAWSNLVLSLLY